MPTFRLDSARLQPAFDAFAARVSAGRVSAGVLAVATPADIVRAEPFGTVRGRPAALTDRYFIASITKPIVATAVMQLVQEGRIVLTEPLRTYLPGLARDRDDVTTWHVLTHTSGVPDLAEDALLIQQSREDIVRHAFTAPLSFVPGSRYEYCSASFYLLAELIAAVDGEPFDEALRRRVLGPLRMRDTSFSPFDRGDDRWVQLEGLPGDTGEAEWQRVTGAYLASIAMPGAGLWSTAGDLVRFAQAYLRGGALDGERVLGRPFADLMGREQTHGILEASPDGARQPRDPHYALGWGKPHGGGDVPCSERAIEHGGVSGTRLFVDPARDVAIVVLANRWGATEPSMSAIGAVHGALVVA